ncbi:MAG TPA: YaaR family protein [Papillibacter sp.]|jgi:uncharacterized protein YaaR (DUF327 family)|nr:YaaR family protein [Papillibacter sp.]
MDIQGIRRPGGISGVNVPAASASRGDSSGGFKQSLHQHLKDDMRDQADKLLSEMRALADELTSRVDIAGFERYRALLQQLLGDIAKHAYVFVDERVRDPRGGHRIFSALSVIDEKLDALAKSILEENQNRLDFLSRVDELRGLIMDILL